MRKNLGAKTAVYPMPVFMIGTYDAFGTANLMNAAWGGIAEDKEISICVSDNHKTTRNILMTGAFTVSMATADYVKECDYLGLVSGDDVPNKVEKCGFHATKSEFVNAPLIDELPMAIECEVISYDSKTCRLHGRIVNISADESVLTDGKIDPKKLRPITYDSFNHHYLVLGEVVGNAFSDGKAIR
ncbi:MAG: flavin reductase family protein [Ruminococcaceae bacterium]|nr:flavin reductase family protein [Oscillospiraceae bacterium]